MLKIQACVSAFNLADVPGGKACTSTTPVSVVTTKAERYWVLICQKRNQNQNLE